MKTERGAGAWVLPSLDVLASLIALCGLLPIAGGLPGIATQGQPIIDGFWFTVNLRGALLIAAFCRLAESLSCSKEKGWLSSTNDIRHKAIL